MLRIYFGVVAPVPVVVVGPLLWLLVTNDPEGSLGGAVFAGLTAVGVMGLILWAVSWRPLVRAETANLALAGVGEPPRRREPSHWMIAWLVALRPAGDRAWRAAGEGLHLALPVADDVPVVE